MRSAVGRRDAEKALEVVRKVVRTEPDVFGTGLTKHRGRYAVKVMTLRHLESIPDKVAGVSVIQDVGTPPQAWTA